MDAGRRSERKLLIQAAVGEGRSPMLTLKARLYRIGELMIGIIGMAAIGYVGYKLISILIAWGGF